MTVPVVCYSRKRQAWVIYDRPNRRDAMMIFGADESLAVAEAKTAWLAGFSAPPPEDGISVTECRFVPASWGYPDRYVISISFCGPVPEETGV